MIRLELFGPPRVVVDGRAFALAPRDAALLAWLAVEGPTAREKVLELLWPHTDRVPAQSHLRQNLRRLKERCGPELVHGDPVLELADGVEAQLHLLPLDDEALLRPPSPALLAEIDASDWPRFEGWLEAMRERATAHRRTALERRSDGLERLGEFDDALCFARRLVEDDASHEEAHRRLMWLHFRRGDLAAARAAFDACRRALARARGGQPGPRMLELLQAIEHGAQAPEPAFAIAANVVRPPRLVGREAACRAVDAAWQMGLPVLVVGEAGVGKSRLLADLARGREAGMLPVAARRGDAGVAYSLLARLLGTLAQTYGAPSGWPRGALGGLVADWGEAQAHPVTTLRVRQAVDASLDEWQRLGLRALVLDDLHLTDPSSLDWLVHTAGRVGEASLRLLVAMRPDEAPPSLVAWQAEGADGKLRIVQVQPHDPLTIAELLDTLALPGLDAAAWAPPLHALCGGRPFDVLNVLKTMQTNGVRDFSVGPRLLENAARPPDATLARLARLSEPARCLAQVAAIAGQDFDVDLAAALLRVPSVGIAAPWQALEAAGLFDAAGFVHDLVRRTVVDAIAPPIVRTLHREVAECLHGRVDHVTSPPAARIAAHWEAAGHWAHAAVQFEQAATAARARSAVREEVAALGDAVRCHAQGGPEGDAAAFRCECRRIHLLPGLAPLESAEAAIDVLLTRATTDDERAAALEVRSQIRWDQYRSDAALADALEAGRLATDLRLRSLASLRAANALVRLGRHDEALVILEQPSTALETLDTDERLLWLTATAMALNHADRRTEALAAFDQAIAQGRAAKRWIEVSAALNDKSIALVYANRIEDSNTAVREGIASGRLAGLDDDGLLLDTMTLASNLRDLGRFDEALMLGAPLPERFRRAGYAAWAHNTEHDLVGLWLWLGRRDLAYRAMTPLAPEMPDVIRASRLFIQARLLRETPDTRTAQQPADLVQRAADLLATGEGSVGSYVRLKVALELTRDDVPLLGAAKTAEILAEAERREQFMLAVHARVLRVQLLVAARAFDEAAVAARQLVDIDSVGAIYLPEVWWTAWQALEKSDRALADRCLNRAVAWSDRVAREHVPAVFRSSFLTRNPVNVAVRAADQARRR